MWWNIKSRKHDQSVSKHAHGRIKSRYAKMRKRKARRISASSRRKNRGKS